MHQNYFIAVYKLIKIPNAFWRQVRFKTNAWNVLNVCSNLVVCTVPYCQYCMVYGNYTN